MQNSHYIYTPSQDSPGTIEMAVVNNPDNWYPNAAGYKEDTTSKEAAMKICAKQLDAEILFHIKKYCFGAAPEDLVKDFGCDLLSVRPAFSRLKSRGLIADTGRRSKTSSGNNCKIMVAV